MCREGLAGRILNYHQDSSLLNSAFVCDLQVSGYLNISAILAILKSAHTDIPEVTIPCDKHGYPCEMKFDDTLGPSKTL